MRLGIQLQSWDLAAYEPWLERDQIEGVGIYVDLGDPNVDGIRSVVEATMMHGKVLLLTLTGYRAYANGRDRVTTGDYDAWLAALVFSVGNAAVTLRPLHEANGDWYPWSGPQAMRGIAHIKRVVEDAIRTSGWTALPLYAYSPNIEYTGSQPVLSYLPSPREQADRIGCDGYGEVDQPPLVVYGPTVRKIARAYPNQRIALYECGCPAGEGRAHWIDHLEDVVDLGVGEVWWADYDQYRLTGTGDIDHFLGLFDAPGRQVRGLRQRRRRVPGRFGASDTYVVYPDAYPFPSTATISTDHVTWGTTAGQPDSFLPAYNLLCGRDDERAGNAAADVDTSETGEPETTS